MERDRPRTVWFHRDYLRLTGGHLKHSHYFDHVRRMPGFAPRITFRAGPSDESQARERGRLWPAGDGVMAERWEPAGGDVLFLAGLDWRYLKQSESSADANPRINFIQHVRHAHEGTELYGYLTEKAIRICVSREVADAIRATGRTNGPVLTIPNGTDVTPFDSAGEDSPAGFDERRNPITIVGYKRPDLARSLSERLDAAGIEHLLVSEFLDRKQYLELLCESRAAVCLPREREGFYLPALEAMAAGCLVVTLGLHRQSRLLSSPGELSGCRAHAGRAVQRDEENSRNVRFGPPPNAPSGSRHRRRALARGRAATLSCDPG